MKLLSDQVDEREVAIILRELSRVLAADVPGDVVEFGCYVGTTSVYLAKELQQTNKKLFVYDSFAGLPPKHMQDESPAGTQFQEGELLATKRQFIENMKRANVPMPVIKKAWFSDLGEADVPHSIALAFLDGDYYASVRDPLQLITPFLAAGATVIVDDYANEALPGAAIATNEWAKQHGLQVHVEHSLAIIRNINLS